MAPITRSVAARRGQQKNDKSTYSSTTDKTSSKVPKRKSKPRSCSTTAKRAQQKKKKTTHSSTTSKTFLEMPKSTMRPLTRNVASKQAQQKNDATQTSTTTGETFLDIRKRTTARRTRSAAAKQAQQKSSKLKLCHTPTGNKKTYIETPNIRNPSRGYGLHSGVKKQDMGPTESKQFHCIFCNKTSFHPAKPHPSSAIGCVGCKSCRAQYRFRVTAELSCERDVQAALLAGERVGWLTATQGPDFWWR